MPLSEKKLIERIRRAATSRSPLLARGIGDDCAVVKLPHGHEALITTDFTLEDVHFRREWHSPKVVGHRCLTRGLSDIAAMGGEPRAVFLSLALPRGVDQLWVDRFMSGLLALAERYSVPLAGGDTAQSPTDNILADIVVLGSVPVGKAILRSGAKPGDFLYVTGDLGSSVATLELLRQGEQPNPAAAIYRKHFYPEPRLPVGRFLREKKLASAMVDISDGLSTDLSHICEESGVGAVVYAEALASIASGFAHRGSAKAGGRELAAKTAAARRRLVSGHDFSRAERAPTKIGALAPAALNFALHGGDEYELLFTARPDKVIPKTIAGIPITRIGEILSGTRNTLATADGRTTVLKPAGWQHFKP